MCLYIKKTEIPKIAKRNIYVWVVRFISKVNKERICSPYYYECEWEIGIVKQIRGNSFRTYNSSFRVGEKIIGVGAFHSFKNKKGTLKEIKGRRYDKIFKAVIPKGTLYIKGTWGPNVSYASKALKLIKQVNKGEK